MRTRLLPGLVDALARNAARQQARVRLFEIGKVFEDRESEERPAPLETLRVAAAASGDVADAQWGEPSRAVDFHDLKGDLESVAALSGASLDYRSEEHTSELQSLMRISYAVFCLKKKKKEDINKHTTTDS